MAPNPSIPLAALLVATGFLATGFAAEASAIEERIEGFVQAGSPAEVDVAEATGHAANGTVERIYLVLEPTLSGAPVDLDELQVADRQGNVAVVETKTLRDDDGSLAEGRLEGSGLVQVQLALESPMEKGEDRTLIFQLTGGQQEELHLATPDALGDDYTRLDVDQR